MQLDLEAHREPVGQDPLRELARLELTVAWREQYAAALRELQIVQLGTTPFVVGPRGDHELDLIGLPEQLQLLIEVARLFPRARGLHIDDAADARIHFGDLQCAAGLERDAKAA